MKLRKLYQLLSVLILLLVLVGCSSIKRLAQVLIPSGGYVPSSVLASAMIDKAVVCSTPHKTSREEVVQPNGSISSDWIDNAIGEWCSALVCIPPPTDSPESGSWTDFETCDVGKCWNVHAPPEISGSSRLILSDVLCGMRAGQHVYLDGYLPTGVDFIPLDINPKRN